MWIAAYSILVPIQKSPIKSGIKTCYYGCMILHLKFKKAPSNRGLRPLSTLRFTLNIRIQKSPIKSGIKTRFSICSCGSLLQFKKAPSNRGLRLRKPTCIVVCLKFKKAPSNRGLRRKQVQLTQHCFKIQKSPIKSGIKTLARLCTAPLPF